MTSEREAFLLRELQKMLTAEGLLASENDVLVVAARNAWPEYNRISAYICQANRPFQPVVRLGFYSKNNVHDLVPKILETHEDVEMVSGQYPGALGELVDRLIRERRREEGNRHKVLLLSSPDSSNTLRLSHPIPNNKTSKTGKPTAFTMGHCYVASQKLKVAKTTLDLA